ncbi:hypothetical protein BH10CYA1_BH10CYA1_58900 [soil metagenome]
MQTVSAVPSNSQEVLEPAAVNSERAWVVALVIVAGALAANSIFLFWGLNRGLDVDVESFYLVQYQHPYLYPAFSSFHLLLSKLPKLVSNEIMHYRWLEVIARIIPSVVLSLGVSAWANRWLKFSKTKVALMALIAAFGGSLAFACFPRTISYNGLSSGLLTLSTAFVFLAISLLDTAGHEGQRNTLRRWGRISLLFGAGFAVALSMFVKVTSGFVLIPALFAFMYFQKSKRSDYATILGGVAGGVLFFFTCIQAPGDWWAIFSEASKFELLTDHSPRGMLSGVLAFCSKHWWHAGIAAIVAFGVNRVLSGVGDVKRQRLVGLSAWAFAAATLVGTVILEMHPGALQCRESIVVMTTIGFVLTLLSIKQNLNWQFASGIVLLLVFPLIAAVGTNCNILPHTMSNSGPWFVLILSAAFVLADKFKAPYAMAAVPVGLVILSAFQFYEQYLYFRDDGLLLHAQTKTTTKIPLLAGMQLHKEDIDFYEKAQAILTDHGFKRGDTILSLYDFPAIVYLMDAVSPGQSWYISWSERDELNTHYFKKASFKKNQPVFLVLGGKNPKQIVEPEMQDALLDPKFGKKFKRIGVLPHPRKMDFKVYFYASK